VKLLHGYNQLKRAGELSGSRCSKIAAGKFGQMSIENRFQYKGGRIESQGAGIVIVGNLEDAQGTIKSSTDFA